MIHIDPDGKQTNRYYTNLYQEMYEEEKESMSNAEAGRARLNEALDFLADKSQGNKELSKSYAGDGGRSILTPGSDKQTFMLMGIGLSTDAAQAGAKVFQESNLGVRAAALKNNIPTVKIDNIIGETNLFGSAAKWIGRGAVVYSSAVSLYQMQDAYREGDMDGAKKAGLDFGVGLGAAAVGGIPGVVIYGSYMLLTKPLPGNPSGYVNPVCPNDNIYVVPPTIPKFK